jgi:hypothetical protein
MEPRPRRGQSPYCSLCTFRVPQGANNLILCTIDTIHRLFFVTRLIINKINKVQWVDFKLENVLVSLHSLKTMGFGPFGASAPLFLRNGELLGHSPIRNGVVDGRKVYKAGLTPTTPVTSTAISPFKMSIGHKSPTDLRQ